MALDFEKLSWWTIYKLTRLEYKLIQGRLFSASHLFEDVGDTNSVDILFNTGDSCAFLNTTVSAGGQTHMKSLFRQCSKNNK